MFHVECFEPHTHIVIEGFSTLEMHLLLSSTHISPHTPATLFHTHPYPCFLYSTLFCAHFLSIFLIQISPQADCFAPEIKYSCFFLLFPDALYQKYVFLENIFCRDFVFIPGNTRKVSPLHVCFSLNLSHNLCVCVSVCVHASYTHECTHRHTVTCMHLCMVSGFICNAGMLSST